MKTGVVDSAHLQELRAYTEPGQPDFLDHLIDVYLASAAPVVSGLQAAAAKGVWQDVSSLAHKLRGLSADLGAVELRELCADLETAAKDSATERAARVLRALPAAYEAVKEVLTCEWRSRK